MKNGVRKISITPELKIEIPSQFSVTGVKELRVPESMLYLEKNDKQFLLRTLPVIARAASIKYFDVDQNKDVVLRKVGMIAARDGHSQIPITFIEKHLEAQKHMGLICAVFEGAPGLDEVTEAATQITNAMNSVGISSHT